MTTGSSFYLINTKSVLQVEIKWTVFVKFVSWLFYVSHFVGYILVSK